MQEVHRCRFIFENTVKIFWRERKISLTKASFWKMQNYPIDEQFVLDINFQKYGEGKKVLLLIVELD